VGDVALTLTGDVLGTLAYMAPEQAEGRGATPESDLYALALVLYEALAGINPVRGASPAETARNLGEPIPALGRWRRDLPRGLCAAIDTAVSVAPRDRGTVAALRRALAAARADVSDEPGPIGEPPLTQITRRFRREPTDEWHTPAAPPALLPERDDLEAERRPLALPARLVAGVTAGGLAAAALAGLPIGEAPVQPALGAVAVALAVALLPRLAWLTAVAALLTWLVADGRSGSALLIAAAAVPVPLLLPRAGTLWSVPGLAPLLGLAGLSPAYAVAAGQAPTLPRRAALGALGAWWLVLAEPLLGRQLLAGEAVGGDWPGSASKALDDVLVPLLEPRTAGLVAAFAVAAAVLPWLVRGRHVAPDAVAATAWAAGLGAAVQAAVAPDTARGVVVGAVAAGGLALLVCAWRSDADP